MASNNETVSLQNRDFKIRDATAFVLFSSCKLRVSENSLAMIEGQHQSTQQLCWNKGRLKRFEELHRLYTSYQLDLNLSSNSF